LKAELFISADLLVIKPADLHRLDCKSNQHILYYCTVIIV
jgi:hypothetical protein